MTRPLSARRLVACAAATLLALAAYSVPAQAADPVLDLENVTGAQLEKMMQDGDLTSVQLTKAYMARIAAINKAGPGINAVTQFNPDALKEAAQADKERAEGHVLGPAHGLPILLKDIVDAKGEYTSAGNYSLRNSFPEKDSGVAKKLRERGVVILGKLGLSEFANSFGNQHSGFSNLTGQVLNGIDADQNPSGSSSGTGAAAAAALSALTIGTETSGSIISPSSTQGIVGLRPTVGLVPGQGIAPIDASQDTAGPMVRSVSDAAMTLQSIAGPDPEADAEYTAVFGPDYLATGVIPTPPPSVPDYMSALDLNFVNGKKIGYNGTVTSGPGLLAFNALQAAGAIMVPRPTATVGSMPSVPNGYEPHKTIDVYYAHLGPSAPIHSLVEEVADNNANPMEALKFGNATHLSESLVDITPGGANETTFRANLPLRKAAWHKAINDMMNYTNSDPTQPLDPVIGILGSTPSSPQAGYPQITIPMGYNTTTRRTVNISVNGNAYDERNLIGMAYVIEQATHLRQPASMVDPSMYRCAHTSPPEPFAARGGCNPDYASTIGMIGGSGPSVPFSLETETAQSLQARLTAGTLTSTTLTKAYLARIALTNAEGPAIQAVRELNPDALSEAAASDARRVTSGPLGPMDGIPVLVDDSIDLHGLPTTAGSIALQGNKPDDDSTIVAKLKAAGAIILGKTNVTELNGVFDSNLPEGYSSLAGQVLVPSDTDTNPGGSSGGSAAAAASGMAALTVGMETGTDLGAQMISTAGLNGVVALKPTVGRVSRTGILPVAKTQDSPGPIGKSVFDVAMELQTLAGTDPSDPATSGAPAVPNYTAGLTTTALSGKKVAVISSTTAPYPAAVTAIGALGATTTVKTVTAPSSASIVLREFKRDLNAYLASGHSGGASSLQGIIDYNNANPVEGLKYQQGELTSANAVDLTDPATLSTYNTDKAASLSANKAVIDTILNNGTPADPTDDFDVIVVPNGNALAGIADRAGYPMLTVEAGEGTGGNGRNPIGITFVGAPFSEATLLADAYAYEQATLVRRAPSVTNPSMWRCVPYSVFYSPHHCHPGDLQADAYGANYATGATQEPVETTAGGTVLPTLDLTLATSATTSLGTFVPGVAADYTASLAASATSTGGDAALSVLDPGTSSPGKLVNGSFSLSSPLQVRATSPAGTSTGYGPLAASPLSLLSYAAPTSNDPVTLGFKQSIGATEALRTGTYAKTLLFTLSTTTP